MKTFSLNRNQLKYLVAFTMLLDHIAWAFVPTRSSLGFAMHFLGRFTGPTMAFFLAEGYLHTHNVKKYALRLGIFALLSWIPFSLFEAGTWPTMSFGVIFSLFLGLLALMLWDTPQLSSGTKALGITALCLLSAYGDWPYFDVLWPLSLVVFRQDPRKKWLSYTAVCLIAVLILVFVWHQPWFNLGIMAVPLLLFFGYNGEGGSRHPFHKWFFYVFYPAHLLVLAYLRHRVF